MDKTKKIKKKDVYVHEQPIIAMLTILAILLFAIGIVIMIDVGKKMQMETIKINGIEYTKQEPINLQQIKDLTTFILVTIATAQISIYIINYALKTKKEKDEKWN